MHYSSLRSWGFKGALAHGRRHQSSSAMAVPPFRLQHNYNLPHYQSLPLCTAHSVQGGRRVDGRAQVVCWCLRQTSLFFCVAGDAPGTNMVPIDNNSIGGLVPLLWMVVDRTCLLFCQVAAAAVLPVQGCVSIRVCAPSGRSPLTKLFQADPLETAAANAIIAGDADVNFQRFVTQTPEVVPSLDTQWRALQQDIEAAVQERDQKAAQQQDAVQVLQCELSLARLRSKSIKFHEDELHKPPGATAEATELARIEQRAQAQATKARDSLKDLETVNDAEKAKDKEQQAALTVAEELVARLQEQLKSAEADVACHRQALQKSKEQQQERDRQWEVNERIVKASEDSAQTVQRALQVCIGEAAGLSRGAATVSCASKLQTKQCALGFEWGRVKKGWFGSWFCPRCLGLQGASKGWVGGGLRIYGST